MKARFAYTLLLLLVGCMVHKPALDHPPRVAAQIHFQEFDDTSLPPPSTGLPWWESFQDPDLNQLIEAAFQSNLTLTQLMARIDQTRALRRQAGGRLFPMLDVSGDYRSTWENSKETSGLQREEAGSVGLLLDWELDVWGRLRSARKAAALQTQAAHEDWLGGRLFLSVAVADTYYEIIEQRGQLKLLEEQIKVNETLHELTKLRFGQGLSSIVAVLQQREQLASTRSLVPAIEGRLQSLEYSLDVLLGGTPGQRPRLINDTLIAPPTLPAVGLPSDLLQRHPDLVAAQSRLRSLDYRVGEAVADQWPRFNIGGAMGGSGMPSIDTFVANIFANALGPVFDAGIRKAEVDLQRALLEEALAVFSEDFLGAVRDVESALVTEQKQSVRLNRLVEQLDIANQLLRETRNRYSQGLTDYLPVLEAVVTLQNLQRDVLTNRRLFLSSRITLHRALGGPMDLPAEPAHAGTLISARP